MNKKTLIAFAASAAVLTGAASAAPLTDYSAGKTSIDLGIRNAEVVLDGGSSVSFGKKSKLDWGITTGGGDKLAYQINGFNIKSDSKVIYSDASEVDKMNVGLRVYEYNVLYKLNNKVSAYTGIVSIKGSAHIDASTSSRRGYADADNTTSKMQLGLVGSTKIAEKTTAYARVGVASDYFDWKIGLAQEIAPNLELNVDYRRIQAKNLDFTIGKADITTKGLGYGISYKF